jgi:hypothetical protein
LDTTVERFSRWLWSSGAYKNRGFVSVWERSNDVVLSYRWVRLFFC